jgi:hypothetical protein
MDARLVVPLLVGAALLAVAATWLYLAVCGRSTTSHRIPEKYALPCSDMACRHSRAVLSAHEQLCASVPVSVSQGWSAVWNFVRRAAARRCIGPCVGWRRDPRR